MSDIFIVDKENLYSYDDLLLTINHTEFYKPASTFLSLFDLFKNLLVGLLHNQPVILLDKDLSREEFRSLGVELSLYDSLPLVPARWESVGTLIETLKRSKSVLTIFTSGTTGQPKKIEHSVPTFLRSVRIKENCSDIWGYAYNPTHMAGLQVFFQAFMNRCMIVNLFNLQKAAVYNLIDQYQISHISATPTFYKLLIPGDKQYPSVVRITLGGEKSTPFLHDSILKIFPFVKINNIYASTEAGSLFVSKGEYFLIPSDIAHLVDFSENELLLHKSLLGDSDTLKLDGDFYHTGDIVEWADADRKLFRFASRKNELLNVGGYKVNPLEVEECIVQIEEVRNAIVFGKSNSVLGTILCCEIELDENRDLTEKEIRQYLSDKLQYYKIPRFIKFVKELELTRTGKIKRV